jgi:hypothetical protein
MGRVLWKGIHIPMKLISKEFKKNYPKGAGIAMFPRKCIPFPGDTKSGVLVVPGILIRQVGLSTLPGLNSTGRVEHGNFIERITAMELGVLSPNLKRYRCF